ncbi:Scr1 family TA system antitoxin-like transcriptional regulator [Streptomyces sp. NPDC101249]|uniref:Scr1 family TA system antitoxin-like transcriptional regulator n=1 Tax=Streptomyces sp. NPDC101249 TaxID=3366140 RepID=UPI0038250806
MLNARTLRSWKPDIVPGLLQTADYAARVFDGLAELRGVTRDTNCRTWTPFCSELCPSPRNWNC